MSKKPARSKAEAWEALERIAVREEAERIAALSDEELDAELVAHGIDPKAARARGAALAAELLARRAKDQAPRG